MFWLIAKPSTWFLPKFTRELARMHWDCQSQPKLFWIVQFREQAETLPLTIITRKFLWPWSLNPESSLWLARWKRTKRAFHSAFWRKQMKEQFNTHLTIQTISLCCPLFQRKTRGSSFCPLCIPKKKRDEDNGKEEINAFYNQEKGGVDSNDQIAACTPRQEKQTVGQWGSFME